jgi:hypothetical protein
MPRRAHHVAALSRMQVERHNLGAGFAGAVSRKQWRAA